jgi:NADH-quinone oxidoreductase subunit M
LEKYPPIFAIIAVIGIIITVAYILRVVSRVFFGEIPLELQSVGDVNVLDKVAIGMLSIIMVGLGIFPLLMTPWVEAGMQRVLALLGGA